MYFLQFSVSTLQNPTLLTNTVNIGHVEALVVFFHGVCFYSYFVHTVINLVALALTYY